MNISVPIYMDYSATTPVDERVAVGVLQALEGELGNLQVVAPHVQEGVGQAQGQPVPAAAAEARSNGPVGPLMI